MAKLKKDAEEAKLAFKDRITEFQISDVSVDFRIVPHDIKVTIIVGETYPRGDSLALFEGESDMLPLGENITLMKSIQKVLDRLDDVASPKPKKQKLDTTSGATTTSLQKAPAVTAQYMDEEQFEESYGSQEEEAEYEMGYGEGHEDRDLLEAARWLSRVTSEIAELNEERRVTGGVYECAKDDTIRVRVPISTFAIDRHTAQAWCVKQGPPIIVEIKFSWCYLSSVQAPQVSLVCQAPKHADLNQPDSLCDADQDFGVLKWYLKNRLDAALRKNWADHGALQAAVLREPGQPKSPQKPKPQKQTKSEKSIAAQKAPAPPPPPQVSPPPQPSGDHPSLSMLLDMGFPIDLSRSALLFADHNVETALNVLMDPDLTALLVSQIPNLPSTTATQPQQVSPPPPATDCEMSSSSDSFEENEEEWEGEGVWGASGGSGESSNSKSVGRRSRDPSNFFAAPNFLIGAFDYLRYLFENCSKNCIICDGDLGFHGLKPTVCDKPQCTFSHEEFGLGVNVLGEIKNNAVVTDLLISLAYSAALRRRFEPFPHTISASFPEEGRVKKLEKDDYATVISVLDLLPSLDEMSIFTTVQDLNKHLDTIHPFMFPLLKFILTSNRAHIAPLEKDQHISMSLESFQFRLISSHPSRERKFRQMREQKKTSKNEKGSFYAFHGSPVGNWHSILRSGLKNLSGTDKMTHGQALGPGIYFGRFCSISLSYCGTGDSWPKSRFGKKLACLALCEVVDRRKEADTPISVHREGTTYVITEEEIITTRYFFVFPMKEGTATAVNQFHTTPALPGGSASATGAPEDADAEKLKIPDD